jgi:hypothetical protein
MLEVDCCWVGGTKLAPSEERGRGGIVLSPGGDVLVLWKVVVLILVAPGAELAELVVTVGRADMAGSDWLAGGAEDGEIPDCCMISTIVNGAEEVSEIGRKRGCCRPVDGTDLPRSLPFWRLEYR